MVDPGDGYGDSVNEDLAGRLAAFRRARGVSQDDLAAAMGVTQARVWAIENRGGGITVATLERYVAGCGGRLELAAVVAGGRTRL